MNVGDLVNTLRHTFEKFSVWSLHALSTTIPSCLTSYTVDSKMHNKLLYLSLILHRYCIYFSALNTIHARIDTNPLSPCRPISEGNDIMFLSQTLIPVGQSVGAAPCCSTEYSSKARAPLSAW